MANLDRNRVSAVLNGGEPMAVVGHNRVMANDRGEVLCSLHGHVIVREKGGVVEFNPCGLMTPTTTRAMKEFASVLGIDVHPSFRGGSFTVEYKSTTWHPDYMGVVRIQK